MTNKIQNTDLQNEFGYLIEKIEKASFSQDPFKHIIIDNFLSVKHFSQITSAEELKRPVFSTTEKLIEDLLLQNYKAQPFPGCSTNIDEYIKAINTKNWKVDKGLLEGFGMAFRLKKYQTPILDRITQFLNSSEFKSSIEKKFGITKSNYVETAIQKYLQGYEISPHPDIRKKAATYMLNINTDIESENIDIHTFLCKFKPEKSYIYDFWKNNKDIDRCWVPWEWCDNVLETNTNNSIIMFSPSDDSLHAVKLDYNHLDYQRTQIYGNLWYEEKTTKYSSTYKNITTPDINIKRIKKDNKRPQKTLKQRIVSKIPTRIKLLLKNKNNQ